MSILRKNIFSRFLAKAFVAPKLSKKDLILTILPLILWYVAVNARSYVISPHCVHGAACKPEQVLGLDQRAIGFNSTMADQISDYSQKTAGLLGIGVPVIVGFGSIAIKGLSPHAAAAQIGTDIVIWIQSIAWNGSINELTKLASQRPRPYVYRDPEQGLNPANYTSFYSGHTSFTAASVAAILLMLAARGASCLALVFFTSLGYALVLTTAATRVLAGRHFFSDVLIGALAGTVVALAVAMLHRKKSLASSLLPPSS